MTKAASSNKPIAVLIDAENVLQPKLMPALLRELNKRGIVGLRRAYGNAKAVDKWTSEATEFGIEPMLHEPSLSRKNVTDFALMIDALDLMHSGKFSAFCIVSSDGDFLPLAQRIRDEGLAVYNCGEDKKTTLTRKAYSDFFSVETLLKPAVQPDTEVIAKEVVPPASVNKPTKQVLNQFCEVVKAAGGGTQFVSLVSLGHRLRLEFPAFKVKQYKHARLYKFLLAHDDLFECIAEGGKGVSHVRLREQAV